jgi:hypothetical protein
MFEKALKMKLRFPFHGSISTEDLFDLNMKDIDGIYRVLSSAKKQINEDSLMSTKSKDAEKLDLQLEIITYVFNLKKEENEAAAAAVERKKHNAFIDSIIEEKKEADLRNKSVEELEAMRK